MNVFLLIVILAYEDVMGVGAIVNAAGANFTLLGPKSTHVKK